MNVLQVFSKKNSGRIARERLKDIVLTDRLCCSPEITDRIRSDIVQVISKYMELDNAKLRVRLEISDNSTDSEDAGRGERHVKTIQIKRL